MPDPLRILFVASEVGPFARTGGLGDVIGALPKALAALGHDVRILMPLYQQVRDGGFPLTSLLSELQVPDVAGNRAAQVWQGFLPSSTETAPTVPVYFLEQDDYFSRPGLYGDDTGDYPDNAARFTFFCRSALLLALRLEWFPDVFHCHDWQSALIPAYLRVFPWLDTRLSAAATVYTIHNMAYQGVFPAWMFPVTGLPPPLFQPAGVEFLGGVNFMKAGLLFADALTTVSPTYAEEICTPEFGSGLEGVLQTRREVLTGILNGADYSIWSPEHDPLLSTHYDATDLAGKRACKRDLLRTCHLPDDVDTPLIGMISRLVDQKGFDLVAAALERLLAMDVRFVVLGAGTQPYEELLTTLSARYPHKFAVRLGFDNALAHQIEAGSDCFLMPSRYEPCGLNQIYSLRYGTIPIVRSTGGLKDTITPFDVATGEGTGFVFEQAHGDALVSAVTQALQVFADPSAWRRLMGNAMRQDFSWGRSAEQYAQLYTQAMAKRAGGVVGPPA